MKADYQIALLLMLVAAAPCRAGSNSGEEVTTRAAARAPTTTTPTRASPAIRRVILAPTVTPAPDRRQRVAVPPGTLVVLEPPKPCATLHVDAAAFQRGQHDGSIEFPFGSINAAIAFATARQCRLDIVLAPGTYAEDINVEANFQLKGAGKENTRIQGSLRAVGDFQTVLWDVGFVHASPLAIYKEGGTIEVQRVALHDIKHDPSAGLASPGAVQIVNASGVVNGLVADDLSSPALLVEGPSARIKSIGLVISNTCPLSTTSRHCVRLARSRFATTPR